ncbi:MAG: DMT family transporter [Bacillota bacterium]|nr:DMT family transporter [Bacillota bacterium]
MSNIFSFCMAAVAGAAMALQGTFNTAAGKIIGIGENTLLVHVIGAATMGLILLFGFGKGDWSKIAEIPWYGYLGGILSAVIIFAVIAGMSSLGVGNATAVIVLFQVAMALIIDSFGLFGADKIPFSWWRVVGVALLVIGTKCVFYKS